MSRARLRDDVLAGLPNAIGGVPNGMASSVLAGVSPVHGLYASFAGPISGGATTSTKLMVVTATGAAALAAGSATAQVAPADRPAALFLLTVLAGALMIVAGVLRLGRYTRFVPHSVMIGFLTGVAVNIVLGQIPALLGYDAQGSFSLAKAIDALRHVSASELPSLATGLAAIAIAVLFARTRLGSVGAVVAVLVPTVAVNALGADSVARVRDSGDLPQGFPLPHLPQLNMVSLDLIGGAFAVAAIVLVQGAGVAESAPNPDGSISNADRDFVGQGVGNLASGLFQGQPVGGSVGQTALNVSAGARSRWAAIFSGLWMLVILLAFSGLVEKVAMPTLAGILIVAAISSLRISDVVTIWRTSGISRTGMVITFVATMFLPVATAVGIGVVVALALQLNREALDLRVVELVADDQGHFLERPAPRTLPSQHVTVLDVYGSLHYAGARTLQSKLPDPTETSAAAVVLRLRGRTIIGATFVVVLEDYLQRLRAGGGCLFLSGVDPDLWAQLNRFDRFVGTDDMQILGAHDVIGASTHEAHDAAERWLRDHAG